MFSTSISSTIELELLEVRHADELYRVIDSNRGHLREWLPWVDTTLRPEDVEEFIRNKLRTFAQDDLPTCSIRETGVLVGVIDLHELKPHIQTASLGYWLAKDAQGRGIMTAACRAMLDYGLGLLKLNQILLTAIDSNAKSIAIAERLGFNRDGVERRAHAMRGDLLDGAIYSMLASEWTLKREL